MARDGRRYGPVRKRGAYVPQWVKDKRAKEPKPLGRETYIIPAGTKMHARVRGTKWWDEREAEQTYVAVGFLWRNETAYGFAVGDWEFKVRVGLFKEV